MTRAMRTAGRTGRSYRRSQDAGQNGNREPQTSPADYLLPIKEEAKDGVESRANDGHPKEPAEHAAEGGCLGTGF
jgi:hypothetical protein